MAQRFAPSKHRSLSSACLLNHAASHLSFTNMRMVVANGQPAKPPDLGTFFATPKLAYPVSLSAFAKGTTLCGPFCPFALEHAIERGEVYCFCPTARALCNGSAILA